MFLSSPPTKEERFDRYAAKEASEMCSGVPFQITRLYVTEPGWYRTVAEPDANVAGHRHPFIVDRTDYVSSDSSNDEEHCNEDNESKSISSSGVNASNESSSNSGPFLCDYEVEVIGDDDYAQEMFGKDDASINNDSPDVVSE